jgi:hypothetical protein
LRLLILGFLAVLAAGLLTAAVLHGYRDDQRVIHFFAGTGIAGKIDAIGNAPSSVLITKGSSQASVRVAVAADGTFAARLDPGTYRLQLPHDSRSAEVVVPGRECLDLVLDFRLPFVVLEVPGEGWPVPKATT